MRIFLHNAHKIIKHASKNVRWDVKKKLSTFWKRIILFHHVLWPILINSLDGNSIQYTSSKLILDLLISNLFFLLLFLNNWRKKDVVALGRYWNRVLSQKNKELIILSQLLEVTFHHNICLEHNHYQLE